MRVSLKFDRGDGPEELPIGPQAMVAWELKTKSKISKIADDGLGVDDLVTMLWEQLRVDGSAPTSRADLLASLVDIEPSIPDPI